MIGIELSDLLCRICSQFSSLNYDMVSKDDSVRGSKVLMNTLAESRSTKLVLLLSITLIIEQLN